jgi:hypothetical protein
LAAPVVAVYAALQLAVLNHLRDAVKATVDSPAQDIEQQRALKQQTIKTVTAAGVVIGATVNEALKGSYTLGAAAAVKDIPTATAATSGAALGKVATSTIDSLRTMGPRIVQVTQEAFRDSVAEGVAAVMAGDATRLAGSQIVLDDFAELGITGFVDAAGRGWSLESYAEMAVRTGTMQASIQGHMDTLQENGFDLVIVSEDGSPCALC